MRCQQATHAGVASGRSPDSLEAIVARHSAEEMVAALGLSRAPSLVRGVVRAAFSLASVPLGRVLARFDRSVAERGLADAATAALDELGAVWVREGTPPASGALLVVANHPGAYDALVLFAALGRRDVAIVAADRAFFRALPALSRHLVLVQDGPGGSRSAARAASIRRALRHLASGGALLHFGAGRIEPDPAFAMRDGGSLLEPWPAGTGFLVRRAARAGCVVVAATTEGVHSARASAWLSFDSPSAKV